MSVVAWVWAAIGPAGLIGLAVALRLPRGKRT